MSVRKKTKKAAKTHVDIELRITAPHAYITVGIDCDKTVSKKMPTLMRQLADVVESGEFDEELNKLAGVYGVQIPNRK
jgi:hypothetical protein